jgi:diguanylate cyclase (GGDEF)-like protein
MEVKMFKKLNIGKLSLASRSLKYKLWISFYLMSVLPLLVCVYFVSNFILPNFGFKIDIVFTVLVSVFIAIGGFFLVKEVFDRIVSVSNAAKVIAAGDINHKLEIPERGDEIGEIGVSLNQLTQTIRGCMDELSTYGEKTTEINLEIQKRVIVLSSLLQVSSLITQGAKLDDILKITTEKCRFLADSESAYLLLRETGVEQEVFVVKAADGRSCEHLFQVSLYAGDAFLEKIEKTNKTVILDKQKVLSEDAASAFQSKFKLANTLATPIYLKGRVVGILGVGNNAENFLYKKEDIELMDIFAKQVAIALENDFLTRRVEKLEIKDALTGLYNEAFIRNRLQEEIKRAIKYQRPCALVLFDIDNLKKYQDAFGLLQSEGVLKRLTFLISDSVTEVDRVGRTGDDEFAVILPEKNKRQAQEIAEIIRKKIEFSFSEEPDPAKKITVSGGVSENPVDGINAQELFVKAKELLHEAKSRGRNRVVAIKEAPICR